MTIIILLRVQGVKYYFVNKLYISNVVSDIENCAYQLFGCSFLNNDSYGLITFFLLLFAKKRKICECYVMKISIGEPFSRISNKQPINNFLCFGTFRDVILRYITHYKSVKSTLKNFSTNISKRYVSV